MAEEPTRRQIPSDEERTELGSPDGRTSLEAGATHLGPYRLLRRLGEGGMGEVWLAEQERPRRHVALKMIRRGMDTKEVIARFETEREALAMMDHPNIALVFDAGETAHGTPYFVMEYVKGDPITDYCDRNRLTTEDRLLLFAQVCEGVQHAHQKAVIHRDIKPSNILVTVQDDRPVPKIIDFGVAKATNQHLTQRTLFTELGQLIGTPEYMSPEQAEMTGADVDTRTDVYSLGVLLYELLTGVLPFDPKELRQAGLVEIQRLIREEEPAKPSTRVSSLGATSTRVAGRRRTEPSALVKGLRGDLDWITVHALEKDRTRRYGSPAELAQDVWRHLGHEPVLASPPSRVYQAAKFVRRHRIGAIASGLVLLAVTIGAAGATIGLVRATRAEQIARQESDTAGQALDFLVRLFEVSDPSEARGNTVTAREILDEGAEQITRELEGQPLVKARLMDTMGMVYYNLGLYIEAEPLLREALETREEAGGDTSLVVATSLNNLGDLYREQGRYDQAEAMYRRVLAIRETRLEEGNPLIGSAISDLGKIAVIQGRYADAEPLFLQVLEISQGRSRAEDEVTATSLNLLGQLYTWQERYDEAEPLFRRSLLIRERVLDPDHPGVARGMNNLAYFYQIAGQHARAEALFEQTLALQERILGPGHWQVANSLNGLAEALAAQGKYDEAESIFRRARPILLSALGEEHPLVAENLLGLANLCRDQERYDEAEPFYRDALAIQERLLGRDHPTVLNTVSDFAAYLRLAGHEAEAAELETTP